MRVVRPSLYEARKFGGCVARWQVCSGNWTQSTTHAHSISFGVRYPHTPGRRGLRHEPNFWSPQDLPRRVATISVMHMGRKEIASEDKAPLMTPRASTPHPLPTLRHSVGPPSLLASRYCPE